jgi:transposase
MGKPYSMDLRERAVAAVLRGGLSRHKSAAQFGVGISTVINWVRRFQDTGRVAPGQMGGHKPKAIRGEHEVFLARRVREGGFTLRGLVAELAERGLKVDYRSVWNFVHAERLSFKKNRRRQRARSTRHRAPARPVDEPAEPDRS